MMSISNNTTETGPRAPDDPMAKRKPKSYPARPRTRAPSHPGEIIGGILEDIGVSQRQAALAMGITPMALGNVINAASGVSPDMAVRLEAYMGNGPTGAEFWLRLQGEHDLWHARAKLKEAVKKITPAPHEPKAA